LKTRWLLLALPTTLVLGLVLTLAQPDAPEEAERAVRVSGEALPGSTPPPKPKGGTSPRDKAKTAGRQKPNNKTAASDEPDPIAFLERCLARYDRKVRGYRLTMFKQERIGGKLQPQEEIKVAFRERPFGVYLEWVKGARKAERALYVAGENDGQTLVRPYGYLARAVAGDVVAKDPTGPDAKKSGRYPITEFGLKNGTLRTLAGWKQARERHALHVQYAGVYRVKELGDRECYMLHRYNYDRPENDGVTDLVVYIDKETLLQVGSVIRGEGGKLIARYFFHDIELNPEFKDDQFRPGALKP
jgi:hypothetical protein